MAENFTRNLRFSSYRSIDETFNLLHHVYRYTYPHTEYWFMSHEADHSSIFYSVYLVAFICIRTHNVHNKSALLGSAIQ